MTDTTPTDQAAERLHRLATTHPDDIPKMPPLNLRRQLSKSMTVAQAQRLIRDAITARDHAYLTMIGPDLRTVLADRDRLAARVQKLERKARAIRSHIRRRAAILRDRHHEDPHHTPTIVEIQLLEELAGVLAHLYDDPAGH